jgi:glutamate synthase domain-containing protein 3/Pyruvate/2-oxoacid:ferredoxin oxidoreductase delta subunit
MNGYERMSTQVLLQSIKDLVDRGICEFEINASGQHDIGGTLWNKNGKAIVIKVRNPGQRAGAMCLPNTEVEVFGSAPADVGWLNSGGRVIVHGDAGDTTAHCAAGGEIYIGGRTGTRTGALMKHDPLYDPPELWVLKNCGSFSFEFMSGGTAVICGYGCVDEGSVLGERAAVGMVGGLVYFRGKSQDVSIRDARIKELETADIKFLTEKMPRYLQSINRVELLSELSDWKEWRKLVPLSYDERPKKHDVNIKEFRLNHWVEGGIFGDVCIDDLSVNSIVTTGVNRLRVPNWQSNPENSCADCKQCLTMCPRQAINRNEAIGKSSFKYSADGDRCIGCGICVAGCPKTVWTITDNPEKIAMYKNR